MPIVKASKDRVKTGVHFMLGNYALVEGAISAGCNFFGGYPITPANEISERMSQRLPEVGGKFVQGEDELFSIFACTGASLAGGKVMTATASAGYNYMQEGLGYAYTVEAPLVIADVQRCRGENYASQADVYQMRYGASGDYEAIVVCPSSVQELYDYTIWAFNLAEEYRNPVIVMSETTIALMRERLDIPEASAIDLYERTYTSLPPEEYLPFAAPEYGCPDRAPLAEGYQTIYSLNPMTRRAGSTGIRWCLTACTSGSAGRCGRTRTGSAGRKSSTWTMRSMPSLPTGARCGRPSRRLSLPGNRGSKRAC